MGYCFLYKRGGGGSGGSNRPVVLKTALGSIISLTDSTNGKLKGLRIFGKTIQNGTPTPDAPVPLESVGDDGNVAVSVVGENLIVLKDHRTVSDFITRETKNGVLKVIVVSEGGNLLTVLVSAFINASFVGTNNFPAGTYTYNGAARVVRSGISNNENTRVHLILADGTRTTIDHGTTKAIAQGFSVEKITFMSGTLDLRLNDTVTLLPILESGNSAIQTLTIPTPNGLPGIPVSTGGNYTDENGQQWICDEIDFDRGKYVQRVKEVVFNGTEKFTMIGYTSGTANFGLYATLKADIPQLSGDEGISICSHFVKDRVISSNTVVAHDLRLPSGNPWRLSFRPNNAAESTVKTFKSWLAEQYANATPVTVQYILATPIETDLTAEEIAQYSALHTNYPNTTIYNDDGAGMEVKYTSGG